MAGAATAETSLFPDTFPVEWVNDKSIDSQLIQEESLGLEPMPLPERCLTEVAHLNAYRRPDGSHSPWTLQEVLKNLISKVKEGSMPYSVTKTEHPYESTGEIDEAGREIKAYMWLGKWTVYHAFSGLRFHKHPEALKRVGVEIDEAYDTESSLRPGITKVFISPRMTRADATYEDARAEHLADDDAVRISYAETDEQGNITKRILESLLIRDVPLEAWIAMLDDSHNMFGKSIPIADKSSALSVMQVHHELEVPSDSLAEGVISLVAAVVPYIKDPAIQRNIEGQLTRFRENQADMDTKALNIAKRWLDFEVALADSLHEGRATPDVQSFINSMQTRWGKQDLEVITDCQLSDGQYDMSGESALQLATVVEQAKQNFLWARGGIVTGNEKVLKQLKPQEIKQLYRDEMFIQMAADQGRHAEVRALESQTDRQIAARNIKGGGGCSGITDPNFTGDDNDPLTSGAASNAAARRGGKNRERWNIRRGKCVVKKCPTRPQEVKVGPCGVCMDRCQKLFDKGNDPTKMGGAIRQQAGKYAGRSATGAVVEQTTSRPRGEAHAGERRIKPKTRVTMNSQYHASKIRSREGQLAYN